MHESEQILTMILVKLPQQLHGACSLIQTHQTNPPRCKTSYLLAIISVGAADRGRS